MCGNFASMFGEGGVSNFYLTPHRDYEPTLGRWLSADSSVDEPVGPGGIKVVNLADPQTWNLYAYVTDNPTTLNDPTGLGPRCTSQSTEHNNVLTCEQAQAAAQLTATLKNSTQERAQKQTNNGNVIYNETDGLRPTGKEGAGSAANLHSSRVGIGHVLINREGGHIPGGVARSTVPPRDGNNPQYRDSQSAAAQAARTPDNTHGATHFYLHWDNQPAPSWARGKTPVATFGPFLNAAGGGDVPKGADVWIVIVN